MCQRVARGKGGEEGGGDTSVKGSCVCPNGGRHMYKCE